MTRQSRSKLGRPAFIAILASLLLATPFAATASSKSRPTCFGKPATFVGTKGKDHFRGTPGRDVVVMKGGNDKTNTGHGNDLICLGGGDDVGHGSEGVNRIKGGGGDDWLDGRRGEGNKMLAGAGNDLVTAEGRITGGAGRDEIYSYGYQDPSQSPFRDIVGGGDGRDIISGGPNAELLEGGRSNDVIFASYGDDHLRGNGGNDTLRGQAGNDDIDGGSGTDVCDQGSGRGVVSNCP